MVPQNKAILLENGDEFFPAMLAAIRSARASVNMEMFIFNKGEIAAEFARALAAKAREGVEVRILLDDWGSHPGELEELMTRAGVKLKWYKPVRIYSIYKLNNRTHRKILTVDGHRIHGGVGSTTAGWGRENPKECARPWSGRGTRRRPAAVHLHGGLGPHDRRGPPRVEAVPPDAAGR